MKRMIATVIGLLIGGTPLISAAQQQIIKIGVAAPLTGAAAAYGKDVENGVKLAIDEANAENIKLDGRSVRFVIESGDDQGDPRVGVQAAQKLVDDGVSLVVGPVTSGVALPASKIYAAAGIPMITPSATNPTLTRQGLDRVFRIIPTDLQNAGNAGKYAITVSKAKRVAILDDRTAFGQGEADEFKKAVLAAGGTIVAQEFTNDKAVEFNAQLTNIKSADADVLFFGGIDNQGALVAKRMKQLGMRTQFLGGGAVADSVFVQVAGPSGEGALAWEYGRPLDQLPEGRVFTDKFKKNFGAEPLAYSPFAYDATRLAISAMKQAGSSKPDVYCAALKSLRFTGITGTIAFDQTGDLKGASSTLYQVKNGKWTPVTTISSE
jgi:branched-chain amino acid transport system substrate-binding protein